MSFECTCTALRRRPSKQPLICLCCLHARWAVPLIWTPIVLACIAWSFQLSGTHCANTLLLVCLGVALWQLLEYSIHR